MVVEENFYEDIQYLEVISPQMILDGKADNGEVYQVVVFDEYVGQFHAGYVDNQCRGSRRPISKS